MDLTHARAFLRVSGIDGGVGRWREGLFEVLVDRARLGELEGAMRQRRNARRQRSSPVALLMLALLVQRHETEIEWQAFFLQHDE